MKKDTSRKKRKSDRSSESSVEGEENAECDARTTQAAKNG